MRLILVGCLLLLLFSCSGLEKAQHARVKKNNEVEEFIYRNHDEFFYETDEVVRVKREKYPWEEQYIGNLPKITKEYFRCKGKIANPEQVRIESGREIYVHDCGGIEKHSLPLHDNKEFIYPILIELLNYIQEKTHKRVVITSGHRCPQHNIYCDPYKSAVRSKHLIGAEVDFYVEGLEKQPNKVIQLIKNYYHEKSDYQKLIAYKQFFKGKNNSWHNKEIKISISEEEDLDNQHGYPYITVEVQYDLASKRPVYYNWQQAFNGYMRW